MVEMNKEYIHYKNNKSYFPIDKCEIQENDEWVEAIIYLDSTGKKFVRSLLEFEEKFELKHD